MINQKYTAIELGSPICSKLKQIYYPNHKWADCYKQVGSLFNTIKKNARKFYVDKTDDEISKDLIKYTNDNLIELLVMENATDVIQAKSTTSNREPAATSISKMGTVKKDTDYPYTE